MNIEVIYLNNNIIKVISIFKLLNSKYLTNKTFLINTLYLF